MCVVALRTQPESVETLQTSLEALVRQRQHLRSLGADRHELERNREAIVRQQRELGVALIARYAPHPTG
jgi:hypothetical protein